jgi:hypothetical protein
MADGHDSDDPPDGFPLLCTNSSSTDTVPLLVEEEQEERVVLAGPVGRSYSQLPVVRLKRYCKYFIDSVVLKPASKLVVLMESFLLLNCFRFLVNEHVVRGGGEGGYYLMWSTLSMFFLWFSNERTNRRQ